MKGARRRRTALIHAVDLSKSAATRSAIGNRLKGCNDRRALMLSASSLPKGSAGWRSGLPRPERFEGVPGKMSTTVAGNLY